MITTYKLVADIWEEIESGTYSNEHALDLIDQTKATMASHWGNGDDLDESLENVGGRVDFSIDSSSDIEVVGWASSGDGKRRAMVKTIRR